MKYISTIFLILLTTSIAQAGYDDPFYDYRGQNSFREDYPYQPEEKFDPFTGTIRFIYTDIYLPGNGGLDLKIMRVYNSNIYRDYYGSLQLIPDSWVGLGWSLHMGRLVCPPVPDYKYLEMPDGSKHTFYTDYNNPGQWISKEYWILKQTGGGWEVLFTDGVKWIFYGGIYGSIPEPEGDVIYYPTAIITNPIGHQISISYQVIGNQTLIDHITDSCNRIIHFNYETTGMMNLNSIYVHGQYYRYYYDNIGDGYSLLRKVRYPCDPSNYYSYKYDYSSGPYYEYELERVYNPWGGYVDYTFITRQIYGYGHQRYYRCLSQRQETPGGAWTVNYETTINNCDSTVITDIENTKTSFILYGYNYNPNYGHNWKLGLMIRKRITGNGVNLLISNDYNKSPAISDDDYHGPTTRDYYVYVPRLITKEFTIDNKTYTTNYSNFDAYSQPRAISETGDASRTISRTYWYNTNLNIVDRLAAETINYNSTSYPTSYSYNDSGQILTKNVAGVITTYTYHSDGGPQPPGRDDIGNLKRVRDHSGRWIEYSEYEYGVPKIIKKHNVYSITRTVNWAGTIAAETDGRGYTTNFHYDGRNRLTRITPPIGDPTIIEYDGYGNYKKVKLDPGWTMYNYDDWGRVGYTENSVGVKINYLYDYIGRKILESYPYIGSPIWKEFTYDGLDRVKEIHHPDGSYVIYTYYQSKVTYRDEYGRNTEFQYRTFGNPFADNWLVSVKDALNQTTSYAYNAVGYLTSINADGGYNRTYHYNSKFFLDYEISPERGQTNYSYDNAGNLTQKTDANGNTTTYAYDNITRLTDINYPGNTYDISYTYDNADNITVVTTPSNTVNLTYNAVNQVTDKTLDIDGNSFPLNFTYDNRGNITRITYPDNQCVDFYYDNENRVLTIPGYIINSITYHPSGKEASYSTINGRTTTIQFHGSRYWISRITVDGGVMDEGYLYDDMGNLENLTDYINLPNSQSFTYDGIDRLRIFHGPWGNNGSYNYVSGYALSRRHQEIIGSNTTIYHYNSTTHRLSSTTGANAYQFTYDNNGNLLSMTKTPSYEKMTITYDYENRPIDITNYITSKRTIFTYDGQGTRVKKRTLLLPVRKTEGENNPVFSDYCYYITSPNGEVLYETGYYGTTKNKYVYLNGKRLAKVDKRGNKYFYHNDYLGSTKAMTDNLGTKVYSWLGYPFGDEYSSTGSNYNNYRFTGKEYDQSTGFYYFGARYYFPKIGRFITPDPIMGTGGLNLNEPISLNLYNYAKDNPLKYIDPSGNREMTAREVEIARQIMVKAEQSYFREKSRAHDGVRYTGGSWPEDIAADRIEPVSLEGLPGELSLKYMVNLRGEQLLSILSGGAYSPETKPLLEKVLWSIGTNEKIRVDLRLRKDLQKIYKIGYTKRADQKYDIYYLGGNDNITVIYRTLSPQAFENWLKQIEEYKGE